jgi:hypothetical protein
MLRCTRVSSGKSFGRLLVTLLATAPLYVGAVGCSHNANEVAATVTGSQKKADGEPCAKDSECINVCLTASEAEKTPSLQPNTCGRANRVNPN